MGIAIFVPGVSFEGRNLGKVTPLNDSSVKSINIIGKNSVNFLDEQQVKFTELYFPVSTTERGVEWTVTDGADMASIDENGVLSINKQPASEYKEITICATSKHNPTVKGEMKVTVSQGDYSIRDYITNTVGAYILSNFCYLEGMTIKLRYTVDGFAASRNNVMGCRVSGNEKYFAVNPGSSGNVNSPIVVVGNGTKIALSDQYVGQPNEITVSPQGIIFNGVNNERPVLTYDGTVPFLFFGNNLNGTPEASNNVSKIHEASFMVDGEYVHKLIPAVRKSDGIAGLYDMVTKMFYANTGTGTITASAL